MRSRISQLFVIEGAGFRMRFYPTHVSAMLWVDPSYHGDFDEELFLRRYLREGDTVIDVGAHIGFTSLVAASELGTTGKVIAIEPHPRVFSYLRANVRMNEDAHIEVHNFAAGDETRLTYITDEDDDCVNRVTKNATAVPVKMTRLDELARDVTRITLLKLDVEGYELFALRGATRILTHVECIYFESYENNFGRYGLTCADVLTFLDGHGFALLRHSAADTLHPIDRRYSSRECENLIAVRSVPNLLERTGLQLEPSQ